MALINWVFNKQPTIETSAFGAKFIAMKHGIGEKLWGSKYMCRIIVGIPLSVPSYIYGDNKSAYTNLTRLESTLKKKVNSICYHAICESVPMGESLLTHMGMADNLDNLVLTKDRETKKVTFG